MLPPLVAHTRDTPLKKTATQPYLPRGEFGGGTTRKGGNKLPPNFCLRLRAASEHVVCIDAGVVRPRREANVQDWRH
jgi:hypothetical protein